MSTIDQIIAELLTHAVSQIVNSCNSFISGPCWLIRIDIGRIHWYSAEVHEDKETCRMNLIQHIRNYLSSADFFSFGKSHQEFLEHLRKYKV